MPDELRKTVAIILAVLAAFFLYAVFTLPAISATAPAILLIACALGAWLLWPRASSAAAASRRDATRPTQAAIRPCPNCKGAMGRAESVCPHCGSESTAWTLHEGVWWYQGPAGEWQWYDEDASIWRWYKDGTPTSPTATDMTPSTVIDPTLVKPPAASEPKVPRLVDEIERLTALHERGALTDDEFQAAKANLLNPSR